MKPMKVRGLVLREYEAGESDKRLLIFCKSHGRLMVYARGAKKPSSKFLAAAQLFTYGDFVLTQGRGFYALAQADIIESFYPLREDYDRLMAAHMVADVCTKTLWDDMESDQLLLLALKTLNILSKGAIQPLQASCVFLLRFFDVHGLRPQVDNCIICDQPLVASSPSQGAALCQEGLACIQHKPLTSHNLSANAVMAMRHILSMDTAGAFRFTTCNTVLEELRQGALLLWKCHFDVSIAF